ncbi:MAG: hypothetical protein ACTSWC_01150 [Promethearchaeota archaeon]
MQNRLVGIDTAKGFGIFIMILVHLFTQAIAQGDPSLFIPVVSQLSPLLWIILTPLMIMGVWGSVFTVMTCLIITRKMLSRNMQSLQKNTKRNFSKFLMGRILMGGLLLIIYSRIRSLAGIRNSESRYRMVGNIELVFSSDTIDSIVLVGIIIPLILRIVLSIPKFFRPLPFVLFFSILGFGSLFFSPIFIQVGENWITFFNEKNWVVPEWLISKFIYGRFKIAHTFSFGCLGVISGYALHQQITAKQLIRISSVFFFFGLLYLGIAAAIDWHFLLSFADTNIPIPVQVFNLGSQTFLLSLFLIRLDLAPSEIRLKAWKRTIWLRRYGFVSLTIFTIGRLVGDAVYWIFLHWFGPSIATWEEQPFLAWNSGIICMFLLSVILTWEFLLLLWQKVWFFGGMEFWLSIFFILIRFRKRSALDPRPILYPFRYLKDQKKSQSILVQNSIT